MRLAENLSVRRILVQAMFMPGRLKPYAFSPGIVGMRGSMAIRLRSCMDRMNMCCIHIAPLFLPSYISAPVAHHDFFILVEREHTLWLTYCCEIEKTNKQTNKHKLIKKGLEKCQRTGRENTTTQAIQENKNEENMFHQNSPLSPIFLLSTFGFDYNILVCFLVVIILLLFLLPSDNVSA